MTESSPNQAAWLMSEKSRPFEIKEGPKHSPAANEILVKNQALAVNPIDGYLQAFAFFPLKYPTILGQDVAGEVVAVGPSVTRFKEGDRVVGHAPGIMTGKMEETAFQTYTLLKDNMTSELPQDMSYESASVLPLGLSTAACSLFQDDPFLGMQLPTEPAQKSTGKTVLVWGGASSVGSCAIQLSVAAGYEVIATGSAKNFQYLTGLGAKNVVDYNDPNAVDELVGACKDKQMIGAIDCIGPPAFQSCVAVMEKAKGNRVVVTMKPLPDKVQEGVKAAHVMGLALKDTSLGKSIYEDFLPMALKAGTFVPAPEPLVVGKGLGSRHHVEGSLCEEGWHHSLDTTSSIPEPGLNDPTFSYLCK